MAEYIITTDSTAEIDLEYLQDNNLGYLPLNFFIDDVEYSYKDNYDMKKFYNKMREGIITKTSQASLADITELFTSILEQGKDIFHIAFSSSLSGSYNTEIMVANQLLEDYSDRKIVIVDSLAATCGQGMIVRAAVEKKKEGLSIEELKEFVEDYRFKVVHLFTVDDMVYLYRGGRVSKAKMLIANAINIKPILKCNEEGKLVLYDKGRGRKKTLKHLVELMEKDFTENYLEDNKYIIVSHADSLEDANFVVKNIKEMYGIENIEIREVGPTVGAHSGPGTVAIFFIGKNR